MGKGRDGFPIRDRIVLKNLEDLSEKVPCVVHNPGVGLTSRILQSLWNSYHRMLMSVSLFPFDGKRCVGEYCVNA